MDLETRSDDNTDPLAPIIAGVDELRSAATAFETRQTEAVRGMADRLAALETRLNRPGTQTQQRDQPAEEMRMFGSFLRTGELPAEIRSAQTGDNPSGGYVVIPAVDLAFRNVLADISPMRSLAEVTSISAGALERFYSVNARGAQWVSENDTRPQDTATPKLIKHSYPVGEMYAAPVATQQLLDDATVDIAAWLLGSAALDFATTEGEAFLTGTGHDNSPRGLLSYGTTNQKDFVRPWGKHQYIPAGHASAPTDDQLAKALVALMLTVRRPYRQGAKWLMNSTTAIRIRQLQDSAKRFLWAPTGNLVEGEQGTLLGYGVEYDEGMPDIGADAHPVAFGDFKQGYVVVDRLGIRTEKDAVTQKGRVVFDTYKRTGGGAGDFNAIKFLKIAAV